MFNIKLIKEAFLKEKMLTFIIIISVVSYLRSLVIPLTGDEITYNQIAENILKGRYYLVDHPSTVAPIVPFAFTFFKISMMSSAGFVLHKLFNISLLLLGLRFVYLFLIGQKIDARVALTIVTLTVVNPISVVSFSSLYPEAILFFCFWGFIYYSCLQCSKQNLIKVLLFFLILVFTRYLYAVLGIIVLMVYYKYLKEDKSKYIPKIIKYSLIALLPIMIWGKYLYAVEANNLSEISYFNRFKIDNPLLYNIKCGLGIIQHHEVNKVNGVPAFVSLFVPITGFRSFGLSILLILSFLIGYIFTKKSNGVKLLFLSVVFLMLGLVFAGTGFSRYWVVLVPGFYLGYYFIWRKLKLNTNWFINIAIAVALIYMLNELRLDYLVLNKHL